MIPAPIRDTAWPPMQKTTGVEITQEGRSMKAITIIQPWATLLASGHKKNETRSWKTNYRGEILIHAGKNPKDYTYGAFYIDSPLYPYFSEAGIVGPGEFNDLPRGMIIGKATLADCIYIDKEYRDELRKMSPMEYAFGDYRIGRYAWVMSNPVLFKKPIPASGKQGLWNWEGEIEDER